MSVASEMTQSDSSAWAVALLQKNPDLFRLIYDFNNRPSLWIHPQRLEQMPHFNVIKNLNQSSAATRAGLEQWAVRHFQLTNTTVCWEFKEARQRLALLQHDSLAKLALYCGAALRWSRISMIIAKSQIAELKGHIGEHAHAFALRRGRQVVEQQEASQSLPYYSLNQEIHFLGWTTLLSCMGGESESLLSRMQLKLPDKTPQPAYAEIKEAERESAWKKVQKILGEVLTREEMRCFA